MTALPALDDPSSATTREGESFDGADLYGVALAGLTLVRCTFVGADLTEASTSGCTFADCDFVDARLPVSMHMSTAFLRCRFAGASLFDATFEGCKTSGSAFDGVRTMRPLTVRGGDWSYAVLREVDLREVSFGGARLDGADLVGARLDGADLSGCSLLGADLGGASLAGASVRGADLAGVRWVPGADGSPGIDVRGLRLDVAHAVALVEQLGAEVDPTS